jgi:CubicO group peptidase (beta-lactamase class C family)
MQRYLSRSLSALALTTLCVACRVEIIVPPGGDVVSESGRYYCPAETTCLIDVTDDSFDETFIVVPDENHHFASWEREAGQLCAGQQGGCTVTTTSFSGNETLMGLLQQDTNYQLVPRIVPTQKFDFEQLSAIMQDFVKNSRFDGASVMIVHKDLGVLYEQAFGNFTLSTVVPLASVSKVATATLMMSLDRRSRFDFAVDQAIGKYLPYEGHYGDRTVEQLLSNTSGIPGIAFRHEYGPHICQYYRWNNFQNCGKDIYQYLLPSTKAAGTKYSYGGSQWQLAGLVAEHVTGMSWGELFRQFIAEPCGMEVFEYGNMLGRETEARWDGTPDGLLGKNNPNIEAGAISNLQDYGKLIALHLNDGWCGHHRVLNPGDTAFMRIDRIRPPIHPEEPNSAGGYGMGWWIRKVNDTDPVPMHYVPGGHGSHAWIDIGLDYGAVLLVEAESPRHMPDVWGLVYNTLLEHVRQIMSAPLP